MKLNLEQSFLKEAEFQSSFYRNHPDISYRIDRHHHDGLSWLWRLGFGGAEYPDSSHPCLDFLVLRPVASTMGFLVEVVPRAFQFWFLYVPDKHAESVRSADPRFADR